MVSDERLAEALRVLLSADAGFHIGLAGLIEIGQLENLHYWVESRSPVGEKLWEADDLQSLDAAITAFLRLRQERQLGYDLEAALEAGKDREPD